MPHKPLETFFNVAFVTPIWLNDKGHLQLRMP